MNQKALVKVHISAKWVFTKHKVCAKFEVCNFNLFRVAVCVTPKNVGARDQGSWPRPRPLSETLKGVTSRLSLGTYTSNLTSVASTVLEVLAFNAHKFRGHVTLATPLSETNLRGYIRTVPGNTSVKFEIRSFNRLELLAFNVRCAHTDIQTDRQTQTNPIKTLSAPPFNPSIIVIQMPMFLSSFFGVWSNFNKLTTPDQ